MWLFRSHGSERLAVGVAAAVVPSVAVIGTHAEATTRREIDDDTRRERRTTDVIETTTDAIAIATTTDDDATRDHAVQWRTANVITAIGHARHRPGE